MKSRELELTFLAREIPKEIIKTQPQKTIDIYIPENSDFPILRLRQKGNSYELTKKSPARKGDYSTHIEDTIELSRDEFLALRVASKRSVTKNRFAVIINGYNAEVDVFLEDLAGLVLIDFEFDNEQQRDKFQTPDCCLVDVTQQKFILGGQLAGKSYMNLKHGLDKFNYMKLP